MSYLYHYDPQHCVLCLIYFPFIFTTEEAHSFQFNMHLFVTGHKQYSSGTSIKKSIKPKSSTYNTLKRFTEQYINIYIYISPIH